MRFALGDEKFNMVVGKFKKFVSSLKALHIPFRSLLRLSIFAVLFLGGIEFICAQTGPANTYYLFSSNSGSATQVVKSGQPMTWTIGVAQDGLTFAGAQIAISQSATAPIVMNLYQGSISSAPTSKSNCWTLSSII